MQKSYLKHGSENFAVGAESKNYSWDFKWKQKVLEGQKSPKGSAVT